MAINNIAKTVKVKCLLFVILPDVSELRNMKNRRFIRDILNHCYQRSADGGVLFYSRMDHLVYFTLYCVLAREYDIQVLSLCQMPDHVHDSVVAKSKSDLVKFKRELNSRFAKLYNDFCGTSGQVFDSPFGSAPKQGPKAARSNLIYVANNPVERQLVRFAEEYRWNYLAYFIAPFPFSKEIVIRRSSKALRIAVKAVRAQFKAGLPMNYTLLKRLSKELSASEVDQLTDFIISTYNVIDYKAAIRFFDDFPDMMKSIHSNTGSEYDLNEVFLGKTDKPYATMTHILMEQCGFDDIHQILSLSKERKQELYTILRKHTDVMDEQIFRYLHIPYTVVR